MSVVYDLVGFQSRDHAERGIARYVLQLALALERTSPGLVRQYLMHPDMPFPSGAEALVASGRVVRSDRDEDVRRPSAGGVFIAGSVFETFNLPSELVLPRFARSAGWRKAAVVYDFVPALFPDLYLPETLTRQYYRTRLAALTKFDHLLAISQASADDVCAMLSLEAANVTVIGAGADDRFRPPPAGHEQAGRRLVEGGEVPGLRQGYVFFPTGFDPRKNIERTIRAYGALPADLRRNHQLVLTCRLRKHEHRELDTLAADCDVTDDLLITGYVTDDILCRLYQGADLVIFPSLYEGFGLPALEAMKCGAPVICADASSLREVQPLADARFDPSSCKAIAAAISHALSDRDFRQSLRTQTLPPFSWDNAAELTAGVIARLRERTKVQTAKPSRPRLALFSPLPLSKPQAARSGAGLLPTETTTYAWRLVEELRHHCEITVFVDTNQTTAERSTDQMTIERPDDVRVEPTRMFEPIVRSGGEFDRTLAVIADNRYHVDAFRMLERHGGWALFIDQSLTELYGCLHERCPDQLVDGSVGATLAYLYPGRYQPELEKMSTIPDQVARRSGVLMARQAVASAERVFVHSRFAASLLELDTGAAPEVICSLPCPAVEARRLPAGPPIVATFGAVTPDRGPDKIVSALGVVRRTVPDARVRFFGPVDEALRRELLALAEAEGLDRGIEFVTRLDGGDLVSARREATVAVHLTASSTSESSLIVGELLAVGVPTIVTELGPLAELPDDAVNKVGPACGAEELGMAITRLLVDDRAAAERSEGARRYAAKASYAQLARELGAVLYE